MVCVKGECYLTFTWMICVILNNLNIGYVNETKITHLMYAGDLVIISPSAISTQVLLNYCDD